VDSASWQKAKPLLVEALNLPEVEREAFVRQRCEDPAVCAELIEMLEGVRTRDEFPASRESALATQGWYEEDDAIQLGTKVGPYLVVDRIGRGGMGQVFLGTDPRLERRVALKCLLGSHATGPGVRSGILHEARAAARISNQHVAAVYDVIEHDTRAFIVMEYVDGKTLAVRLRKGRLTVEQTLTFGRQLVLALAAAHAEGLVHRDLKPGNIQVTPAGSVKVLDFGIAYAVRRVTTGDPSATTTAGRPIDIPQAIRFAQPGTPPYMSPEQIFGRHVDERSDIFSLGVVLFEMCTGKPPFEGVDAAEIAVTQLKGVPRADAICPEVPRLLADVIERAMALDVAKRYQTVDDVGLALAEVELALQEKPPVSWRELIRRWIPRLAMGGPAVILGLGVLGFLTSMQFNFVFGLYGEFARFGTEPWKNYVVWGLRATAPVLVVMTLAAVVGVGAPFILRLVELIGPIGRFARRVRGEGRKVEVALGLNKSAALAQGLVGLGIVTLALFIWSHADLIQAWSSFFNSSPIERLMPMTDSAPERNQYHNQLSVVILAFSFGLYRVMKKRRQENAQEGRAGVVMLGVLVGVMVVLNALPWRTLNRRNFPRIDSGGAHCYITGESGDEFMVLCPGSDTPRNRIVRKDSVVEKVSTETDPRWHRTGARENVFKGVPFGFVH
jgi:hypothetical protein